MKKDLKVKSMFFTLLLAFTLIAATTASVMASSPNPGIVEDGKISGPTILGTITYQFDGSMAWSFDNVTCLGKPGIPFIGSHFYSFASEIYPKNVVGNIIPVEATYLGTCTPPKFDPGLEPIVDVVIRAAHSIVENDDGSVTAQAVLLFVRY